MTPAPKVRLLSTLAMPSHRAWGDPARPYQVMRYVDRSRAETLLMPPATFTYAFGDGWVAQVAVSRAEATWRAAHESFAGYDWMVDSIIVSGEIIPPSKKPTPEQRRARRC